MASHNESKNSKQINVTDDKRGKTRATKSQLVFVLYLIDWVGFALATRSFSIFFISFGGKMTSSNWRQNFVLVIWDSQYCV